ncbi:hypothetical protein [Desulfotomaculum copahuensis]|uniref:Type 4 fimbrial biogenesis protein PilX N-terminal domain-containing protein n=1 Tax=Desulfotomaculum copahuensis TaxID=1838280 RepID=A0A1B7LBE2_9FIRM|nr:hypothetical protein [Desulfotomaculum copahuensis]OAT79865.1 hypothetical protein A6M21_14795 [Desulfotomaculum copahuensis]
MDDLYKRVLKNETGMVLAFTLVIVLILSIILTALLISVSTTARIQSGIWQKEQARYLAQAGVQRVIFETRFLIAGKGSYFNGALDTVKLQQGLVNLQLQNVTLGNGEYTISNISHPVTVDAGNDITALDISFESTGSSANSTVALLATLEFQFNQLLLSNQGGQLQDAVMLNKITVTPVPAAQGSQNQ